MLCCRQMSSAVAEAEKLRAAGDAHKRDLVQAKLVEREAELAAMRDKLRAANREVSSAFPLVFAAAAMDPVQISLCRLVLLFYAMPGRIVEAFTCV